jgi:hypothetical protein
VREARKPSCRSPIWLPGSSSGAEARTSYPSCWPAFCERLGHAGLRLLGEHRLRGIAEPVAVHGLAMGET